MDSNGSDATCGERGFTLIEVLIALFLTAMLLTSVYYTFFSILGSREVISEELERQREIRRFVDLTGMEIESSYVNADSPKTFFTGYETGVAARRFSNLKFTYFTHAVLKKDRPAGDLKVVRYSVGEAVDVEGAAQGNEGDEGDGDTTGDTGGKGDSKKGGGGGRIDLFKEKWDAFTGLDGKGSFKVEVVEDIKSFNVRYFNGTTWSNTWQSSGTSGAPEAVKFELIIKKGDGTEKYIFTSSPRINVAARKQSEKKKRSGNKVRRRGRIGR